MKVPINCRRWTNIYVYETLAFKSLYLSKILNNSTPFPYNCTLSMISFSI